MQEQHAMSGDLDNKVAYWAATEVPVPGCITKERPAGNLHNAARRQVAARRGFTLLEMLVVLSLLGVMLSMAWPSMRRTLGKSQLREAAKQVRTQLATARLSAIESGQAQQFRFQPGTGRYVITPLDAPVDAMFDPDEDAPVSSTSASTSTTSHRHSEMEASNCRPKVVQALCGGVVFGTSDRRQSYGLSGSSGSQVPAPEVVPVADELRQHADWSAPIIFYPNGRSADATVRLYGDRDFQVDVNLRGVMGTVEVAAPVRVPENMRR